MDSATPLEPQEPQRTPALSLLLGFGPMLPFALGAVLVWTVDDAWRPLVLGLVIIWGGSILCFLAGVRRGLSFRTQGGARVGQVVAMLLIFVLGLLALLSPWALASLGFLLAGYLGIAVLDPHAARNGGAPPFFARLRPLQMLIPAVCLPMLALRLLWP